MGKGRGGGGEAAGEVVTPKSKQELKEEQRHHLYYERKVSLKKTYIDARDWPQFRSGYFDLFKFFLFCGLYFYILTLQLDVSAVYRIDEALRQSVIDEGGALQEVTDHGAFFDYLTDTIMPNVFPSAWYNDEPLATADTGFVLDYNKLVGGLLLTQKRGTLLPACKIPFYTSYPSSYESFYGDCFSTNSMAIHVTEEQKTADLAAKMHPTMWWEASPGWTAHVPWTTKIQSYTIYNASQLEECKAAQAKRDPRLSAIYAGHGEMHPKCVQVVESEASPPLHVNKTRSDPALKSYYKAFTYTVPSATRPPSAIGYWMNSTYGKVQPQEADGSFRVFLAISDGPSKNSNQIEFLRKNMWLDKFTREIQIKFAVYNGMRQVFTFVAVEFGFSRTGGYKGFNTEGGTRVRIKSVNMEPYRLTQTRNCTPGWTLENNATCYEEKGSEAPWLCHKCGRGRVRDEIQLACEVLMMIWVFYECCVLIRRLITHCLVGWADQEDTMRPGVTNPGLKTLMSDFWFYLDSFNMIFFVLWIAIRIALVSMILSAGNRIEVPTNQYEMVLEYAEQITQKQLLMNFFNILMCLVRMFKFYRFQPRLAIVNQTLQKAAPDLFHFLLMFVTFIYGFSVITHILFGPQLIFFASISESMATTFTYMLTAAPNQAAVANVDGEMAVVWYLCFMIIVTIILLNVLLAILVDSYMAAKEEELEHWQELGYEELPRHVVEEIEDKGRGDGGVRTVATVASLTFLHRHTTACAVYASMIEQLFSLNLLRHLVSFGAIHEALLLRTLEGIKKSKEEEQGCPLHEIEDAEACVTIADIYEAIPENIRENSKVTMGSICKSGSIRWLDEEEDADPDMEWLDNALKERDLALAPPEEALYLRIQELAAENARLYEQHHKLVDEISTQKLKKKTD